MHNPFLFGALFISFALFLGCKKSPEATAVVEPQKSQEEIFKAKIESLVADSEHDTSTDSSRVRSLCTYCGAWRESDTAKVVSALGGAALLGTTNQNEIQETKRIEAPFLVRHLEVCGKKGGMIKAIYPDESGWSKLDPQKREN